MDCQSSNHSKPRQMKLSMNAIPIAAQPNNVNVAVLAILLFCCPCLQGDTFNMSNLCGLTINMKDKLLDEIVLELTNQSDSWNSTNCQMNIVTYKDQKLSFKILEMNLEDSNDTLVLYGESTNTSDILYKTTSCNATSHVHITPGSSATVSFSGNSTGTRRSFTIVITSFFIGECTDDYFECTNKRCIKSALKCNTRDNCGDNSDESEKCQGTPWYAVLVIVLGVMVVFLISAYRVKRKYVAAQRARDRRRRVSKSQATVGENNPNAPREGSDNPSFSHVKHPGNREQTNNMTTTPFQQHVTSGEVNSLTHPASSHAVPPAITIYPHAAAGRLPPVVSTDQSEISRVPPPPYDDVKSSDSAFTYPDEQHSQLFTRRI